MDEQMIELIARAIAEADGIVLPTHATVHMLAASHGWAVAKRYERLAIAAHSVMAGKVAELVEALERIANARTAMDGGSIAECRRTAAAALAPYPERRSEHHE